MSKAKLTNPKKIRIPPQYWWNSLPCEHIKLRVFAQWKTISFFLFKPLPDSDASEVTNIFLQFMLLHPALNKRQENLHDTKKLKNYFLLDGLLPYSGQAKSNNKFPLSWGQSQTSCLFHLKGRYDPLIMQCHFASRSHPSSLNITSKSYLIKVRKDVSLSPTLLLAIN